VLAAGLAKATVFCYRTRTPGGPDLFAPSLTSGGEGFFVAKVGGGGTPSTVYGVETGVIVNLFWGGNQPLPRLRFRRKHSSGTRTTLTQHWRMVGGGTSFRSGG